MHNDVKTKLIRNGMNRAMSSKGNTIIWNPRSKFNVKRKIKDVRLTFGNNIELNSNYNLGIIILCAPIIKVSEAFNIPL